jgi:acyl carrier protein
MNHEPSLRLISDWPRIRQRVAKRLGKTESDVQAMSDSGDSLERVELVMTIEEVLDVRQHK